MALGCMASSGTRSLVIIDDVPAERNSKFLAIFVAQIQKQMLQNCRENG